MPHAILVTRRATLAALISCLISVAAVALPARASAAAPPPKPTVVLVHGAFADASGWAAVTERLQSRGYTVVAPPNPLRGLATDAAYISTFLSTLKAPVVLVGHSYGGAVITNAARGNPNVKALVYIAAYGPDEGDSVGSLTAQVPGGMIGPAALTILPFPTGDGNTAPEGIIKPKLFRHIFAADLPAKTAAAMAASQRPAALSLLSEASGPPAWKTIPSWYLVAGQDNAIGTTLERFMAKRMGATTIVVKGSSHVAMMSHPRETVRLILDAAAARSR